LTLLVNVADATITTVLDGKPLYEWTSPIASLSLWPEWSSTGEGRLAFGALARGWEVSQVKLKRLGE
jgi:hypothetical protein